MQSHADFEVWALAPGSRGGKLTRVAEGRRFDPGPGHFKNHLETGGFSRIWGACRDRQPPPP
ncbi:hypothetical protein, partial [Mycolicibacterium mucogenicum]|uniref:hypothetical protein n=1 Tax=Mycolicibacterium mucogenicum TaxID=56689 RepID=UPI0019513AAC